MTSRCLGSVSAGMFPLASEAPFALLRRLGGFLGRPVGFDGLLLLCPSLLLVLAIVLGVVLTVLGQVGLASFALCVSSLPSLAGRARLRAPVLRPHTGAASSTTVLSDEDVAIFERVPLETDVSRFQLGSLGHSSPTNPSVVLSLSDWLEVGWGYATTVRAGLWRVARGIIGMTGVVQMQSLGDRLNQFAVSPTVSCNELSCPASEEEQAISVLIGSPGPFPASIGQHGDLCHKAPQWVLAWASHGTKVSIGK